MVASPEDIDALDPYSFFAALGKKVVRPGGTKSTQRLYDLAALKPTDRVLDVGCGVGTTGIEIVKRFGCNVTLVDHSPLMLGEARRNVDTAGVAQSIEIQEGDILKLAYEDGMFDAVIVEAVTVFVDRWRAVRELRRVTKPGGRVVDQEMVWLDRPDADALEVLRQPQMCPGIDFDDVRQWGQLFENAGWTNIRHVTGPFQLIYPREFVRDEGVRGTARILSRVFSHPAYLKKSVWLARNLLTIMPKVGYIIVYAENPAGPAEHKRS